MKVLLPQIGFVIAAFRSVPTWAQPANDLCENAEVVNPGGDVLDGSVNGAESDANPVCNGVGSSPSQPGVWYTAIGNGNTLEATTCTDITNDQNDAFDSTMTVWDGSCTDLNCIDSDLDGTTDGCNTESTVIWDSVFGKQYWFYISGNTIPQDNFRFQIRDRGPNPRCGNGILETNRGEECDDGNTDSGDGCSATCTIEACIANPCPVFQRCVEQGGGAYACEDCIPTPCSPYERCVEQGGGEYACEDCIPDPCPSFKRCVEQKGGEYACEDCIPEPCSLWSDCVDNGGGTYDCIFDDPCDPNPCDPDEVCLLGVCFDLDPCDPNPCGSDKPVCVPYEGSGDGTYDCFPVDPCDPNPCGSDKPTCVPSEDGKTYDCVNDITDIDPCFSGINIVDVQGKGNVMMSSLQIGDYVQVYGGSYAQVYSFGHYNQETKTTFLQIQMGKDHPLEISANHLLYVKDEADTKARLLPAEKVKVGDYLVTEHGNSKQVTSIHKVQCLGFFAPHTNTGNILVSGVLASTYATRQGLLSKVPEQLLHWLQHGAAAPYRLYCSMIGGCQNEAYNQSSGFSPYNMVWIHLEQWVMALPGILRVAFLLILATPLLLCSILLGMLLSSGSTILIVTDLVAALIGFFLIWNWQVNFKKALQEPTETSAHKSITKA